MKYKQNIAGEQELIKQLISGDMKGYERLYELFYPSYLVFTKRLVNDDSAAEDIMQNVFLKVWEHRQTLDCNGSIKAYLFVLTKREVLNVWRRKRRTEISLQDVKDLLSCDSGVEQRLEREQTLATVNRVVAEMPMQRKLIFTLSRYDNCTNREIAERLNISVRTVEKHLELAIKFLKRALTILPTIFILF
ncbi:MAG: RNA polymerase sigma-70 factor [Rikenellaceae bacterium]